MALDVEDGTIVAGANSYADETTLTALAAECGVTLVAADVEEHAKKATRYLESYRTRYQGAKTDGTQSLQWPRTGACLDGTDIGSNVIPQTLIDAQVALMIEQFNGNTLFADAGRPSASTIANAGGQATQLTKEFGPFTKTEKWSAASTSTTNAGTLRTGGLIGSISMFEVAINPLLKRGGGFGLTAVRA